MSVSIPDPQTIDTSNEAPIERTTAKVVQLPLDGAARQRQEIQRINGELRRQLILLSRHYAKDATRFQEKLEQAHTATRHAQLETNTERQRSANAEAELFGLRGDILFIRERLSRERRRAARLAEVARLPWWAFARRRWALASIEADEAG